MEVRPQGTAGWRRLAELIAEIETAMLVTAEPDGVLHGRPLRTLEMDADGALWFMTTISSAKIGEMDAHRRVSLSYMRPANERCSARETHSVRIKSPSTQQESH